MEGFSLNAIQNLNTLFSQNDTKQVFCNQEKDVAPPQTILEINNNRLISTHASKPENQIWAPNEIKNIKIIEDERIEPDYECLYKQTLVAEDIYLGTNDLDPSSTKCQGLIIRVNLPESFMQEIMVNIEDNNLQVQTPKYNLNYYIPEKIDKDKTKVKWNNEKYTLEITFVIKKLFQLKN